MFINDIRCRSMVVLVLLSLLLLAGCGDNKGDQDVKTTKKKNLPLDLNKSYSLIYGGFTSDTSSAEIVVAKADGSDFKLITQNYNSDVKPQYCSKTKQIVFVSNFDKDFEVYISDNAGKHKKNLTLKKGIDDNPIFTPDCKFVIFESQRDGNKELYQVRVDGSELKRLTNNKIKDVGPFVVSPDGRYVAFRQTVEKPIPHFAIFLLDRTTLKTRKLTNLTVEEGVPAWAPNGKFLVFSVLEKFEWHLYKSLPNGTGLALIDNPKTTSEYQPSISPDSSKIAFIGIEKGDFNVWISDVAGKIFTQITDDINARSHVRFSPDNKFVAYLEIDENQKNNIFLSTIDGKKKFQLTENDEDDRDPEWIIE